MSSFRVDSIARLARQLSFTPQATRLAQMAAAEELLFEVQPLSAYPLDFIIFRITGYHPKKVESGLITGLALQHDLGLLIEQVSRKLNLLAADAPQPVLSIGQVSERFNVTGKTIQRWRRRGLAARRFIYPDGKSRVGFLVGHVERFIRTRAGQTEQVARRGKRGMNLAALTDGERQFILSSARRLAGPGGCPAIEIARRLGRQLNRSPLTIASVLRDHDAACPNRAILSAAPAPLDEAARSSVYHHYRRGESIASICRQTRATRSVVYRAIRDERLGRLLRRKAKFIDDPLYHGEGAAGAIHTIVSHYESQRESTEDRAAASASTPKDLPPWLAELYRTPLLGATGERAMFLKLNFHKFQFAAGRSRLDEAFAGHRDLLRLERARRDINLARNAIVRANLRLVVSVAKKHLRPGLSMSELLSDGSVTLMRAVDSFDIHKGNRFSTYATLALMKGFARDVPLIRAAGRHGGDAALETCADPVAENAHDRLIERDQVNTLLGRLTEQESRVVRAYYGLGTTAASSYEQVSRLLGMTQRRVRQIERAAMAKLRAGAPAPG
jgi:RNA polymerase sigma factor (sigma-70 family)